MDRYFDAARFWRDIGHVMTLSPAQLRQYLAQAERLHKLEHRD
jgi:hypothetical protein